MKPLLRVSIIVFSILLIFTFAYAEECNSRCCDEEYPKIVVQGEGKIETLADKANFKVNVRVEEKKLERAFDLSTEKINSITEILAKFNIKKEDIRNLGYVYHPLYEGKRIFSSISRPTSYEVVYTLKISVYDSDKLGKILAGLSEITETTVYGLEYTSTKIEELKREALKKAASDAREKAITLAEGAGAGLGKVIKIESTTEIQPVRPRQLDLAEYEVAKFAREKAAPQVESGYLEIVGNCTVYYSIQ